jgi:hypothetical protein
MLKIAPRIVIALAVTAALAGGCAARIPPAAATTPSGGAPAAPALPAVPAVPAGSAVPANHPAWGTGPVTVTHNPPVPPVPVVVAVRYAAHTPEGYDRIVFDISGGLPGYSVRYVSEVRADPSDRPVTVPGRRHLLIVLNPAQAHRDGGPTTVSGVHTINLPTLTSYAIVGDYEGHVSIALGLDDTVGYHVAELPGRIYLDVAA